MREFDLFLSYSGDVTTAAALRDGVQSLARQWNRRRALRVFLDTNSLSVNEDLWAEISRRLDASRHFALLASPEAAASRWVNREIAYWSSLPDRPPVHLVLMQGDLVWDAERREWDAQRSTALPPALRDVFQGEPLWLDLRWCADAEELNLDSPRFRAAVADLAAPVHGVDRDDLEGEDVRQHRVAARVRRLSILALALLCVISLAGAIAAIQNAGRANRNAQLAEARAGEARVRDLASSAQLLLDDDPALGALVALEAYELSREVPASSGAANQAVWAAVDSPWRRRLAHPFGAASTVFSPNGSVLATAGRDGVVSIWSIDGELVREIDVGGEGAWLEFSSDGAHLLVARGAEIGDPGAASLWNVATGRPEIDPVFSNAPLVKATFDSSGLRILVFDSDGMARVIDLKGRLIAELPHESAVWDAAFSPDGELIATAAGDKAIVWDVESTVLAELPHDRQVLSVEFSPDGSEVLSGASDDVARIWRWQQAELRTELSYPDRTAESGLASFYPFLNVRLASFSPSGSRVVTLNLDRRARLWTTDGALVTNLLHDGLVTLAEFAPDGSQVVTGSTDGRVRLWDEVGDLLLDLNQRAEVRSVALSDGNGLLLSAGLNGDVNLWELASVAAGAPAGNSLSFDGSLVVVPEGLRRTDRPWSEATPPDVELDRARDISFNPDGSQVVASTTFDATVFSVDGSVVSVLETTTEQGPIPSPAGDLVLTIGPSQAELFSYEGQLVAEFDLGGESFDRRSMAFSPEGDRFVVGLASEARVFRTQSGDGEAVVEVEVDSPVVDVQGNDDSEFFVLITEARRAHVVYWLGFEAGSFPAGDSVVIDESGSWILSIRFDLGQADLYSTAGRRVLTYQLDRRSGTSPFLSDGEGMLANAAAASAFLDETGSSLADIRFRIGDVSGDGRFYVAARIDGSRSLMPVKTIEQAVADLRSRLEGLAFPTAECDSYEISRCPS